MTIKRNGIIIVIEMALTQIRIEREIMRVNLREMRDKRNLTQAELARRACVPQAVISNIETGDISDPRISTMIKLSEALRCDVYDLLLREDNPSHDKAG